MIHECNCDGSCWAVKRNHVHKWISADGLVTKDGWNGERKTQRIAYCAECGETRAPRPFVTMPK